MRKLYPIFVLFLSFYTSVKAQCDFEPTITSPRLGVILENTILYCDPSDSEILSTQEYDSYQWFRRDIFEGGDFEPISGATSQTFTVDEDDIFFEFFVEVIFENCTEQSQIVTIDGFAFGLPFMITTFEEGSFEQVGQAEFNVCEGSVVTFENGFPVLYDEHTWFSCTPIAIPPDPADPCIIDGEIGSFITVSESGNYGFYSCTEYCPELCEFLGDQGFVEVNFGEFEFCNLNVDDNQNNLSLNLYPNPSESFLFLGNVNGIAPTLDVKIIDISGRVVLSFDNYNLKSPINVSQLAKGTYFIKSIDVKNNKHFSNKFIKK